MEVRNEMGVIVVFATQAKEAGFEVVDIGEAYPDAIIRRDGLEYRAEFEFKARNFISHKHDPRQCDLIICWENDFSECVLPIVALSESGWQNTPLTMPTDAERELAYWKYRALLAESKLRSIERKMVEGNGQGEAVSCSGCGRSDFATIQALNAHTRFCKGTIKVSEEDEI